MFKKFNYLLDYSYSTDVGKVRLVNEDQVLVTSNTKSDALMVLADGLGGHNSGDYASRIAVNYLSEEFKKKKTFITFIDAYIWLQKALRRTNRVIFTEANKNPLYKGMGTTIVICLLHKNRLFVCNIGDSRAYIVKENRLVKVTEDQSLVDYLKRSGQINEDEAKERKDKNILTDALGTLPSINYNFKVVKYDNEDVFLCSDGLFNFVKEEEILNIVKEEKSSREKVQSLIARANLHGGKDNVSIAYLRRKKYD